MTVLSEKIGLRPNNKQASWLRGAAGCARFAYNWGLARWKSIYESGGKPNRNLLNKELNSLKKTSFPWMYDYPWSAVNAALKDLELAFKHFFRRVKSGEKPGYPRFKSKRDRKQSFEIEGRAVCVEGKRVRLPKIGWLRLTHAPRLPGKILSARIVFEHDRWWICLSVELDESWVYPHRCESQAVVGVDLGVSTLATLSTGEKFQAPRPLRKLEARLRSLSKELSRRKRGGKNWNKTRKRLSRLHFRIQCVRSDYTHKLTSRIVRRFRVIGMEDLDVKSLQESRLAKSVSDAAMSEVARQVEYKAKLAGCEVVKADRFFPSTKTCSACGHKQDIKLHQRVWTCDRCQSVHDRDINAAINLKKLAAAHAVTACCPTALAVAGQESGSQVPR